MLHEPAAQDGVDAAADYKMKLGLKMFAIFSLVYAGFVGINVVKPALMERPILFGMNLASVYGIGLIVFALALALVYNHLCTRKEKELHVPEPKREDR